MPEAKMAPETVVMTPNENPFIVEFDFTSGLGSSDIATINSVTIAPAGLTENAGDRAISGKKAQTSVNPSAATAGTVYEVTMLITSNGSPAEPKEGVGRVLVDTAG